MKKLLIPVFIAVLTIIFSGCATIKERPFHVVQPIPSDKGIVYIYSDSSDSEPIEVLINNSAIGLLKKNEYIVVQCKPESVNVSAGWETEVNNVMINVEPGRQYYVYLESQSLFFPRQIFSLGLMPHKRDLKPMLVTESVAMSQLKKARQTERNNGFASVKLNKMTTNTELSKIKRMYVDIGKKEWETAPFLADGLILRGYEVKTGLAGDMPSDTQCLVKIQETWFWDLTTYLLALEVKIMNPQTKEDYAIASVTRAVPQGRRGPKIMVTEVLNAIFNGGIPAGVEVIRN